jgi:hypothetical protein
MPNASVTSTAPASFAALSTGREDCLIGHTGFVGGTLTRQARFDHAFNSATIGAAAGRSFGTLVCAAAPGSMFEANRFPERDAARIEALIESLSAVRAERFVLISSIAVLEDFAGGDTETTTRFRQDLAYGRNRRALEAFVERHFERSLVVRLPALFASGLKKNFLFDLMNPVPSMLTSERLDALRAALPAPLAEFAAALYADDAETGLFVLDRAALDASPRRAALDEAVIAAGASAIGFHHPETTYQFYNLDRLWADTGTALAAGLSHIHLATEPLEAARIHQALTGRSMPASEARLHREDMRTIHAGLWGREGPYLADAAQVLGELEAFHRRETARARRAA